MMANRIIHFVVLVLLLLAAIAFFYRAFLYSPHSYDKILSYFLQTKQLHTELNKDILKVSNGILRNYDTLVKDIKSIQKLNNKIGLIDNDTIHRDLPFITKKMINLRNSEIPIESSFQELRKKYYEASKQEVLLIEDFKRNYSIYRNSLTYFPVLIHDVEQKLPQTSDNIRIKYKLEEFLGNILMFSINGSPNIREKINTSRNIISSLVTKLPDEHKQLVDKIVKHKNIIIQRHDKILLLIDRISTLNTDILIDQMHDHYLRHKEIDDSEIESYRILFYIFTLMLVIYISGILIAFLKKSRDQANEANQLKSQFLASISHELRTPMNGIIGTSELLLDSKLTKSQNNYLRNILLSAENLLELLNDLLDFSKIESGKMQLALSPFDLKESVESVLELMKVKIEEKKLKVKLSYEKIVPRVFNGDELKVKQVLYNLIGNSIKFTEKGSVDITVTQENKFIKIAIIDTGIGLSDEQQSIIFNKFMQGDRATTRKYGGTGLGLAICKELVEMMGGEIGVESQKRKGSTFWFTVKIEEAILEKNKETKSKSVNEDYSFEGMNILMVEDNRVNAEFTKELLSSMGCTIIWARDGLEAYEIVSAQDDIDLVFMDCDMPKMDGFEASSKIREFEATQNKKRIPVIALTANAMKGDDEKCKAAGMDDYLTKPVRKKDLATMLDKWITQHNIKKED